MPREETFEVEPPETVRTELERGKTSFTSLLSEAIEFLNDADVDDMSLARMYIERGYSEEFAYWFVREAEVRRAPG